MVGIIGLGLLGGAIAQRLIVQGVSVAGYDILADKRDALSNSQGVAMSDAQAMFDGCDEILLSLPTSDIVRALLNSVHPRPGTLILDTTTGDPVAMQSFGEELRSKGVEYCDATIAGSSQEALRGEVLVMVGGEVDPVERGRPLLERFATSVIHVGPCGSGARMKLVVNLVLGLNRLVLAEGLAFAEACGVDPDRALTVLLSGPAASQVMRTKGPKMLRGDYAPVARLSQHLKDVRLILDQGRKQQVDLPVSTLHERLLADLEACGFGNEDNSAIRRAFRPREM